MKPNSSAAVPSTTSTSPVQSGDHLSSRKVSFTWLTPKIMQNPPSNTPTVKWSNVYIMPFMVFLEEMRKMMKGSSRVTSM